MKRFLSYISLILLACCLYGCMAEKDSSELASGQAELKLFLNMPGEDGEIVTRAGGTGTEEGGLDHNTQEQRYVRDITVLIIQENKVIQVVDDPMIEGQQGANIRIVTLTADATEESVDAMVLINARENGISADVIRSLVGKDLDQIRSSLIFSYPSDPAGDPIVWNLSSRYLPMWGMTKNLDLSRTDNYGSCDIYRSVAKMAFLVDEECAGFQMEEIYIYKMEQKGYLMSEHAPDASVNKQYTKPDVPLSSIQTGIVNSVVYDVTDNAIVDRIFIPESDNKNLTEGKEQLKVVVGGTWSGEGMEGTAKKNYWRIDMYDELDNPYDIVRNHSYIYKITKVDNPGTPTPDKALEDAVATLKVEVEEWTPQYMRGVPDQYTLTTSKSVITLDNYMDTDQHSFDVWTDYGEGWTIETDNNGNIIDSSSGDPIEWLEINTVQGPYNQTITVKVNAEKINLGGTLTNRFWIKAGNIRKEITVIFPQPPTANSYVVGDSATDGEYSIIVGIKGNGADGTRPEGVDIVLGEEGLSPTEDATLHPHSLGIIWETKAGLISLKHPVTGEYSTGTTRVPYDPETNSLDFITNLDGAEIGSKEGGNALIGAFDENGVVIWSWHIWVCPEMYDSHTGQIKEDEFLENWTLSGYQMMDRNLGALSNVPFYDQKSSVASMGLQYQWGRKDPFIGPNYSHDYFTGDGLIPVVHYYENWGVNGQKNFSNPPMPELASDYRNIDYTVAHPTQLVYWNHSDGNPTSLVSLDNIGGHLWGTNAGLSTTVKELGTKTIYDPCPVGYRVPPVDAFVFEAEYPSGYSSHQQVTTTYPGNSSNSAVSMTRDMLAMSQFYPKSQISNYYNKEHVFVHWFRSDEEACSPPLYYRELREDNVVIPSNAAQFRIAVATGYSRIVSSFDSNFGWNVVNIPFNIPYAANGDQYTRRLEYDPNWIFCLLGPFEGRYYKPYAQLTQYEIAHPKQTMLGLGRYHGFYMNYAETDEPKMKNGNDWYILASNNPSTITWLPLTGAYDPTYGVTFKYPEVYEGNINATYSGPVQFTIQVESGSSITVNSFLWTNSSVVRTKDNITATYPAGLALHGAEPRGGPSQDVYYASYYGRHLHGISKSDVQADRHYTAAVRCIKDVKKVTWDNVNFLTSSISISTGGTAEITLRSVNGSWTLVDPGAPWLLVTPDKGEANGGDADNNITLKVKAGTAVGSTTTISFQIEGEDTVRKCTVTVTN